MNDTPTGTSETFQSSDPVDVMARALDQLAGLMDRVDPARAAAPTPCASWDVATLLDHVVADLPPFIAGAKGEQADWSAHPPSAAPDWAAAFRRGADELLAAWRSPRPAGAADGAKMPVDMATAEFAVHAWDLAAAIGARAELDPAPAERGLAMMEGMLQPSMRGSEADGKVFGPEVPLPGDASAYDRLVAFAGRDPRWSPPVR
jgi:uncharacterized protein (TIGR03086 family)